jgi:hypothetical protein
LYVGALAAVTLSALFARLPGWNPESLWNDDLELTAILRADDFRTTMSVPAHSPPGFIAALWSASRLFGDPEWSVQLVPFLSGIAAVPVMGLAVRALTASHGLALLAAALAALNPLLAHYTVFVRSYALDFLVVALLLWMGGPVAAAGDAAVRRFASIAVLAGVGAFFSLPSVFLSFPLVNLGALRASMTRHRDAAPWVVAAAVYNLFVAAAYFLLRSRANPLVRERFRGSFLPLGSLEGILEFFSTNVMRLLASGLPSWGETKIWDPRTVSWPLVFVAAGLIGLMARKRSRGIALVIVAFFAIALAASALQVYPMGSARTDIYAFPVVIALCALGVHALTVWLPRREWIHGALGAAAIVYALVAPVRAEYWDVNDKRLIQYVVRHSTSADGLILSPAGTYLAAVYGPWPVAISTATNRSNATRAEIVRDRTLHLASNRMSLYDIRAFLTTSRPLRIWFVAFRTPGRVEARAFEELARYGYSVRAVERAVRGEVYLALLASGSEHQAAIDGALENGVAPPNR